MGMSAIAQVARRLRLTGATVVAIGVCTYAGALAPAAHAVPSEHPFEIAPGSFSMTASTPQAGAYEDLKTEFDFAKNAAYETYNEIRTVEVEVPTGFMGSETAVPTCNISQMLQGGLFEEQCPPASQVGTISFDLRFGYPAPAPPTRVVVPVYNMVPTSAGLTTEFGFRALTLVQVMPIHVRPGDYGLTLTAPNIEDLGEIQKIKTTIWGVPGASSHDSERGANCFEAEEGSGLFCFGGGKPSDAQVKPLLSNPTNCTGAPPVTKLRVDSWEHPATWSEAEYKMNPIVECDRVPFSPSIEVQPSTRSAESPSGVDLSMIVPQNWEQPELISSSTLKDVTVALPRGMTINPSAGAGLAACSPAQYAAETLKSSITEGCPPESKIGSIEIETPVLGEKIDGSVYVATPFDNPFSEPGHPNGALLALYIVARARPRGITVKVAGQVHLDPVTGQLVSTFLNNPQQPFRRFTLKFRPGATAPLVSPPTCGSFAAQASLTPWSAPLAPQLTVSPPFTIGTGVNERPCPIGGVPAIKPQVISGTQNNDAGAYSPFSLRISREDGEQEITKFSSVLPPGLTGNLTGIPFCSDADIEAARAATGKGELESPSCPTASEIGHSLVGAGVGTVLAWTPGKVYLAGPYHRAPMSVVSITSATVGPFDLGTVVIRFALDINPTTAQVEISGTSSDPIPHIIDGIVVHVRDIHVYIDRQHFIINPTSCEPFSIANTITGTGADPANPADQMSLGTTTRFQAADCSSLGFSPRLSFSTQAKTSRTEGASLTAKVTYPNAPLGTQSNIAKVHVELPLQLPSRLTTLQKACPDTTFDSNPATCPAASRVGSATAMTPLIPAQLAGPAYFVSHGGAKFPELIIVLSGYGITIQLHGETFISKAGVTSTTFNTIPDQPIGSFQLTLPQGPDSALAANGNLCAEKLVMPTTITAQNGAVIEHKTPIDVEGCTPAIRVIRHSVKGKWATVVVSVPSAGRLVAAGGGVVRATRNIAKAGTVTLKLRLSRAEQRFIARHHARRLRVPIKLSFKAGRGKNLHAIVAVLMK